MSHGQPCGHDRSKDALLAERKAETARSAAAAAAADGTAAAADAEGMTVSQSSRHLIGLPHVLVKGVGENGQKFIFDASEWNRLVNTNDEGDWVGKEFNIVQYRGAERIWQGPVRVNGGGATSSSGRRRYGLAHNQWEINDHITKLVSESDIKEAGQTWNVKDSIELGKADWMFDDTIPRFAPEKYKSTSALNKALAAGETTCPQGICICFSQSQEKFFLLCRRDQRAVGLHLFEELKRHYPDRNNKDFPCSKAQLEERGMVPVGRECTRRLSDLGKLQLPPVSPRPDQHRSCTHRMFQCCRSQRARAH